MKSTEIKYLMLLNGVDAAPAATHAELADAIDSPPSLVNRYLKRLEEWGALIVDGAAERRYDLTPSGRRLVGQGTWELLAFAGDLLERHRERSIEELREEANRLGIRRAVIYGAVPLAGLVGRWARCAGLDVVATCDEERAGEGILRLDGLGDVRFDGFILADRERAEDAVLLSLLEHYAPVINPFLIDGSAEPDWDGRAGQQQRQERR